MLFKDVLPFILRKEYTRPRVLSELEIEKCSGRLWWTLEQSRSLPYKQLSLVAFTQASLWLAWRLLLWKAPGNCFIVMDTSLFVKFGTSNLSLKGPMLHSGMVPGHQEYTHDSWWPLHSNLKSTTFPFHCNLDKGLRRPGPGKRAKWSLDAL